MADFFTNPPGIGPSAYTPLKKAADLDKFGKIHKKKYTERQAETNGYNLEQG